ncbi:unnamed protein product [Cuscuta campestris]|uniref:Uncharacterized protein n=1 Tax=Cuscuta campestris TaxID=132261 RepID=A0A484KB04_9ASTE|nr:unnamed protein product [Cuscuta campestris]
MGAAGNDSGGRGAAGRDNGGRGSAGGSDSGGDCHNKGAASGGKGAIVGDNGGIDATASWGIANNDCGDGNSGNGGGVGGSDGGNSGSPSRSGNKSGKVSVKEIEKEEKFGRLWPSQGNQRDLEGNKSVGQNRIKEEICRSYFGCIS